MDVKVFNREQLSAEAVRLLEHTVCKWIKILETRYKEVSNRTFITRYVEVTINTDNSVDVLGYSCHKAIAVEDREMLYRFRFSLKYDEATGKFRMTEEPYSGMLSRATELFSRDYYWSTYSGYDLSHTVPQIVVIAYLYHSISLSCDVPQSIATLRMLHKLEGR